MTCGARLDGCDCDLLSDDVAVALGLPRGHGVSGCECHDCYRCGRIDCACSCPAKESRCR